MVLTHIQCQYDSHGLCGLCFISLLCKLRLKEIAVIRFYPYYTLFKN